MVTKSKCNELLYIVCFEKNKSGLPYYIIVVSEEKLLGICLDIVHNSNPSDEINNVFGRGEIKIISTLMPSVAVNPLQAQLRRRRSSVGHDRIRILSTDFFGTLFLATV